MATIGIRPEYRAEMHRQLNTMMGFSKNMMFQQGVSHVSNHDAFLIEGSHNSSQHKIKGDPYAKTQYYSLGDCGFTSINQSSHDEYKRRCSEAMVQGSTKRQRVSEPVVATDSIEFEALGDKTCLISAKDIIDDETGIVYQGSSLSLTTGLKYNPNFVLDQCFKRSKAKGGAEGSSGKVVQGSVNVDPTPLDYTYDRMGWQERETGTIEAIENQWKKNPKALVRLIQKLVLLTHVTRASEIALHKYVVEKLNGYNWNSQITKTYVQGYKMRVRPGTLYTQEPNKVRYTVFSKLFLPGSVHVSMFYHMHAKWSQNSQNSITFQRLQMIEALREHERNTIYRCLMALLLFREAAHYSCLSAQARVAKTQTDYGRIERILAINPDEYWGVSNESFGNPDLQSMAKRRQFDEANRRFQRIDNGKKVVLMAESQNSVVSDNVNEINANEFTKHGEKTRSAILYGKNNTIQNDVYRSFNVLCTTVQSYEEEDGTQTNLLATNKSMTLITPLIPTDTSPTTNIGTIMNQMAGFKRQVKPLTNTKNSRTYTMSEFVDACLTATVDGFNNTSLFSNTNVLGATAAAVNTAMTGAYTASVSDIDKYCRGTTVDHINTTYKNSNNALGLNARIEGNAILPNEFIFHLEDPLYNVSCARKTVATLYNKLGRDSIDRVRTALETASAAVRVFIAAGLGGGAGVTLNNAIFTTLVNDADFTRLYETLHELFWAFPEITNATHQIMYGYQHMLHSKEGFAMFLLLPYFTDVQNSFSWAAVNAAFTSDKYSVNSNLLFKEQRNYAANTAVNHRPSTANTVKGFVNTSFRFAGLRLPTGPVEMCKMFGANCDHSIKIQPSFSALLDKMLLVFCLAQPINVAVSARLDENQIFPLICLGIINEVKYVSGATIFVSDSNYSPTSYGSGQNISYTSGGSPDAENIKGNKPIIYGQGRSVGYVTRGSTHVKAGANMVYICMPGNEAAVCGNTASNIYAINGNEEINKISSVTAKPSNEEGVYFHGKKTVDDQYMGFHTSIMLSVNMNESNFGRCLQFTNNKPSGKAVDVLMGGEIVASALELKDGSEFNDDVSADRFMKAAEQSMNGKIYKTASYSYMNDGSIREYSVGDVMRDITDRNIKVKGLCDNVLVLT